MGQKVNPTLYRLSINKHWRSPSFYGRNSSSLLIDIRLRNYFKNLFINFDNLIIKKYPYLNSIYIATKVVEAEQLNKISETEIVKHIKLLTGYEKITLDISKAKLFKSIPIFSAQLLSKYIIKLIETRKLKSIKRVLSALKENHKIMGYAIKISGRINGVAMARHKIYRRGKLPLQSITSSIDYNYNTALTKYGIIGVKVWLAAKK